MAAERTSKKSGLANPQNLRPDSDSIESPPAAYPSVLGGDAAGYAQPDPAPAIPQNPSARPLDPELPPGVYPFPIDGGARIYGYVPPNPAPSVFDWIIKYIDQCLGVDESISDRCAEYRDVLLKISLILSHYSSSGVSGERGWSELRVKLHGLLQAAEVVAAEACPAKIPQIESLRVLVGAPAGLAKQSPISARPAAPSAESPRRGRGRPADPHVTQERLVLAYESAAGELRLVSSGSDEAVKAARRLERAYERLKARGYPVTQLDGDVRLDARRMLSSHKRAAGRSSPA